MAQKRILGSALALLCFYGLNSVALSKPLSDRGMRHVSLKKDGAPSPNQIGRGYEDTYIPADWRKVPRQRYESPKLEIRLLKGHVSPWNENWTFSNEYVYSPKGFHVKQNEMNRIPVDEKTEAGRGKNERQDSKKVNTELTPRGIIGGPTRPCASGEMLDPEGKCRPVFDI